jgi:hypothetical protein
MSDDPPPEIAACQAEAITASMAAKKAAAVAAQKEMRVMAPDDATVTPLSCKLAVDA